MLVTEFLITSLVVIVVPGTGVIYTVSTALTLRSRASTAAALGCTTGIVPHLAAGILGLSAILHMSSVVFQILKIGGALYLLFLAWSMWRHTGTIELSAQDGQSGGFRIALRGFLINILNPKLSLFFLAFLPQFLSPDTTAPAQEMLLLGAVFMAMTAVVFILYGLLASSVSRFVTNSPRAIRLVHRSFAIVFAALAIRLVLATEV